MQVTERWVVWLPRGPHGTDDHAWERITERGPAAATHGDLAEMCCVWPTQTDCARISGSSPLEPRTCLLSTRLGGSLSPPGEDNASMAA